MKMRNFLNLKNPVFVFAISLSLIFSFLGLLYLVIITSTNRLATDNLNINDIIQLEHMHLTNETKISATSPLDQFTIRDYAVLMIGFVVLSLTSIGLYLVLTSGLGIVAAITTTNYGRLIANRWSIAMESIYVTVHGIVTSQINTTKGQTYFPLIYVLFIFILVNNLVGMIPYSFSPTSHFILTFFMSFSVVGGSTILGLVQHKLAFFCVFVPAGCPLALLPLLVLIETISYLSRNISLGLRLGANVLSGHMLLNILSGFTYKIFYSSYLGVILAIVPAAFIAAFCALEIAIAFIQAQVFCVLGASYIKDGLIAH